MGRKRASDTLFVGANLKLLSMIESPQFEMKIAFPQAGDSDSESESTSLAEARESDDPSETSSRCDSDVCVLSDNAR